MTTSESTRAINRSQCPLRDSVTPGRDARVWSQPLQPQWRVHLCLVEPSVPPGGSYTQKVRPEVWVRHGQKSHPQGPNMGPNGPSTGVRDEWCRLRFESLACRHSRQSSPGRTAPVFAIVSDSSYLSLR